MKRLRLRLAGIALIVLSLLGILMPPLDPARLIHAHPQHAVFFSIHQNPAGRLPVLAQNPLAQALIASAGMNPADISDGLHAGKARLLSWLLAGECTLACSVCPVTGMPDTWSFTDDLGWKTTPARLLLQLLPVPGLEKQERCKTYTLYRLRLPNLPENSFFMFAVVDEGLIGCLSSNPRAVHVMLDRYIDRTTGLRTVYDELNTLPDTSDAPDKGWAQTAFAPCLFAFESITTNTIRGLLRPISSPNTPPPSAPVTLPEEAAELLPAPPLGILTATPDYAARLIAPLLAPPARPALDIIRQYAAPQKVFAFLLPDKYEARFMRMKIPTLIVGLELPEQNEPIQTLNHCLDALNARSRLGLIPEKLFSTGTDTVYAIEGTTDNAYSRMPKEERIACATTGRLLLLSNSAQALTEIIRQKNTDPRPPATPSFLRRNSSPGDYTVGQLWFDLQHGGKALRLALTVYGLKRLQEAPADSLALRQGINEAQAWIDALGSLHEFEMECVMDADGGAIYRFRFGPYSSSSNSSI